MNYEEFKALCEKAYYIPDRVLPIWDPKTKKAMTTSEVLKDLGCKSVETKNGTVKWDDEEFSALVHANVDRILDYLHPNTKQSSEEAKSDGLDDSTAEIIDDVPMSNGLPDKMPQQRKRKHSNDYSFEKWYPLLAQIGCNDDKKDGGKKMKMN